MPVGLTEASNPHGLTGPELAALVAELEALLEDLTRRNVAYLRAHPDTPPLFVTTVRYRQDPDDFTDRDDPERHLIPYVLERGWGDCGELAAWYAAERRVHGDPLSRARIESSRETPGLFHAMVTGRKGLVDPSAMMYVRNG